MKIYIGSDHAGFDLKEYLRENLHKSISEIEITDVGTYSKEPVDYPDFAKKLVNHLVYSDSDFGILICGTGNGMAISANKVNHGTPYTIRATLCWNVEIAKLARQHNDANILVLPARFLDIDTVNTKIHPIEIIKTFLTTEFEGGRHLNRINKLNN